MHPSWRGAEFIYVHFLKDVFVQIDGELARPYALARQQPRTPRIPGPGSHPTDHPPIPRRKAQIPGDRRAYRQGRLIWEQRRRGFVKYDRQGAPFLIRFALALDVC